VDLGARCVIRNWHSDQQGRFRVGITGRGRGRPGARRGCVDVGARRVVRRRHGDQQGSIRAEIRERGCAPRLVWTSARAVLSGTGTVTSRLTANSFALKLALSLTLTSRRVRPSSCTMGSTLNGLLMPSYRARAARQRRAGPLSPAAGHAVYTRRAESTGLCARHAASRSRCFRN